MPTPSLLIVPARFKTGRLYSQIPTSGAGDFTVTRNTEARRFDSAGLVASVASGIPRLDYYTSGGVTGCPALLVEPAATNLVLHSRDLANAVWSGTNVTTAKNAVGADGVASGATTLTATAASGTVLQSLSHGSFTRVFSAYVRRVTGTGAIQMTTNGGTNWTTVTISSLYTQVACAAQTVASGTVGFRMAVSGDVIEVDFTQGEVGPVATSPIPTTAGTGSRSADVISVTGAVSGSIGQTEGTIYMEVAVYSTNKELFSISSGGVNGEAIRIQTNSDGKLGAIALVSNSQVITTSSINALNLGQFYKVAFAYKLNDYTLYIDGVVQTLTDVTGGVPVNMNKLVFARPNDSFIQDQRVRALALYNTRLTNPELATLTTP